MHSFPPLRAIGWIPYFKRFNEETQTGYNDFVGDSKKRKRACDFLFFSGNEPHFDKKVLSDDSTFETFLRTKNYRAAVALREITYFREADGLFRADCVSLPKHQCIGYTPIRNFLSRRKKVLFYSRGVSGKGSIIEPSFRHDPNGVLITYELLFRIGRIGNRIAKMLTGYFAPHAKMRVDYYLAKDGSYTVLVSGSYIPTQNWLLNTSNGDWQHDMMLTAANQLKRFMESDYPTQAAELNYDPHQLH